MANIKNILFDLGGVLLNIDYYKTKEAFEALGYTNFSEMYSQYTADALFEDLETGKLSNELFYEKLMACNPNNVSEADIRTAWNKMLLSFRKESLAFLPKLAQQYQLYLLSNTNAIHLEAVEQLFAEETDYPSLDSFFTKAYYSHRINLRKPHKEAYEFVLKDAGISPEETLFIDDSYNNLEAAQALGIRTRLLLPEERVEHIDYKVSVI